MDEREELIKSSEGNSISSFQLTPDDGVGGGMKQRRSSTVLEQPRNHHHHPSNNNGGVDGADMMSAEIRKSITEQQRNSNPNHHHTRPSANRRRSSLDPKKDPFEPREGKTLIWTKINMRLMSKKKGDDGQKREVRLLNDVWGEVPRGKTAAIMGGSGAGKSSLLNILSGRQYSTGRLKITHDIRLNNYRVDPTNIKVRQNIAFVAQDDSLPVTTTPREIIRFSARLRLPRTTTDEELDELTTRMLDELGLNACAETYIGGALMKGVSGGERKRTSVGVELVTKPAMVFLDEPTSGLDSFNAVRLCNVLRKVANAGSSVLFTIHQPSSEIFTAFDVVILLNKGRIMFQGPVSQVPNYFRDRGHPVPMHYNPADWIMYVAIANPIEQLDQEGFFPQDERALEDAFENPNDGKHDELGITVDSGDGPVDDGPSKSKDARPVGTLVQTKLLLKRDIVDLKRNRLAMISRFGLTVFMSVLIGLLFWNVGTYDYTNPSNLQSAFGAILMSCLTNIFSTVLPSLLQFPEERPVFLREYSTKHYNVVSYFTSRLFIEIIVTALQVMVSTIITYYMIGFRLDFGTFYANLYVCAMAGTAMGAFLGSVVSDPKVAIELLPACFLPQILFSGFFVRPELIPAWLRWLIYVWPLTYSVRILAVEEFEGQCDLFFGIDWCTTLIVDLGACYYDFWWYWLAIVVIFFAYRIGALIELRRKATKFFG